MDWTYLIAILPLLLALLLVSAGIEDARLRTIANWKNLVIALLAPVWWWANGLSLWPDVAIQLGVAALIFAAFMIAFHFGQMGGGDVKLIGALALWFPVVPMVWLLIVMSLIGGALTIVMLVDGWRRRDRSGDGTNNAAQIEIPYGVAIAIAGILTVKEPLLNQFT